jgi:cytochrome c oxidase assembly protein subunit 11
MMAKLLVVVLLMFGFGYALVPMYRAICDALGINVLSLSEQRARAGGHAQGRWQFAGRHHAQHHRRVRRQCTRALGLQARRALAAGPPGRADHGDVRVQERAEPDHGGPGHPQLRAAPGVAHFNKLECFCFNEYTLAPGESRKWPVVFVIDPKLPRDVNTITLSYTFFEVGGKVPPRRRGNWSAARGAGPPGNGRMSPLPDAKPPPQQRKAASATPCAPWRGRSSACAGRPTTHATCSA